MARQGSRTPFAFQGPLNLRRKDVKVAYFDCFSGISGDMCLGALVDAGASLAGLRRELRKLPVAARGVSLSARKLHRAGILSTRVSVKCRDDAPRRWKDVGGIIRQSAFSASVKSSALRVFRRLFEAEALVHGGRFDRVHLHELGALDALADVLGTLYCLEKLGVEKVFSSPVNLGGGTVRTSHGILPVPAPAVAEILKGAPVYSSGPGGECATPTGLAILREIASGFGPMPLMKLEAVGTGAGERDTAGRPNVLRVFIGEASGAAPEEVVVAETNIDDMNPQLYGHLVERLFGEGALDVYLTQVIMKKGRPGVKLTVLCPEGKFERLSGVLFAESTTIGLRFWRAGRAVLPRELRTVKTPFGNIRVKEVVLPSGERRAAPEYEECRRAAKKHNAPLARVMRAALLAAAKTERPGPA